MNLNLSLGKYSTSLVGSYLRLNEWSYYPRAGISTSERYDTVWAGFIYVDPSLAGKKVVIDCDFVSNVPARVTFESETSDLVTYDLYKYGGSVTKFTGQKKFTIPSGTKKLRINMTKKTTNTTTAKGIIKGISVE